MIGAQCGKYTRIDLTLPFCKIRRDSGTVKPPIFVIRLFKFICDLKHNVHCQSKSEQPRATFP